MNDMADPLLSRPYVAVQGVVANQPIGIPQSPSQTSKAAFGAWTALVNVVFVLAAVPALIAVSLLLLVLNPMFNPGPLLYRQERVGRGGRVFRIFKFRTMIPVDTEETSATLTLSANVARITPLGAILRRFRIDELPNFINVALGDMNVIGPRPDAKSLADIYAHSILGYRDRFDVKPGVTGLAQVTQGYADCYASTRKKARYDRFYVRNRDIVMDLSIILRTVTVMRTGFGSR